MKNPNKRTSVLAKGAKDRPAKVLFLSFAFIRLEQEWRSNIPVVLAGLSVGVDAEVRSDSDLSAAVVGIAFVVVLEVGHR